MENSELVQRLQTQLLDLRSSNCELGEHKKYAERKIQTLEQEKDDLNKKLSLETKKNKAISFLPGQSARDELLKLQVELDRKNEAIRQQEFDFQHHDLALRDEINSLQTQILTLESRLTKSPSSKFHADHPLAAGALSPEVSNEEVSKLKEEVDSHQKAVKDLEGMVKRLRTDNEDLQHKRIVLESTEKKLDEIAATAEKRKRLLDEMATEKFSLNEELIQVKQKLVEEAEDKLQNQKNVADSNIMSLKRELKDQITKRKQVDLRLIDANRRIDELMGEAKQLSKDVKSATQTKEYIDRLYEEEKSLREKLETDLDSNNQEILDLKAQNESDHAIHAAKLSRLNEDKVNGAIEAATEWQKLESQFTETIKELRTNINEEIEKQRIVERKAAVTVRELKKQVQIEKKRADRIQEKLRDIDTTQISVQERFQVPHVALHRDEVSSVGSWRQEALNMPTEFDGVTILTGQEADALMTKNKSLMETNLQLEEQLRALEKNQIQMSEELASREEILRTRVWQTRPDAQKQKPNSGFSDILMNKLVEFATENSSNSPSEQSVGQLKALNKKLLRMLEEEMTKNVAMRKNIEQLSIQLQQT